MQKALAKQSNAPSRRTPITTLNTRLINGTGERWISARGRGVYADDGAVVGMLGVVQDISEQVRARETLRVQAEAVRESDERYRAFVENSSEGIWRLEFSPAIDTSLPVEEQVALAYANGRLAECNVGMAHMYQLHSPDDLVGKTLDFMLPASDPRGPRVSGLDHHRRVPSVGCRSKERDAEGNVKYFLEQHDGHCHRREPASDVGVAARRHRAQGSGACAGLLPGNPSVPPPTPSLRRI